MQLPEQIQPAGEELFDNLVLPKTVALPLLPFMLIFCSTHQNEGAGALELAEEETEG